MQTVLLPDGTLARVWENAMPARMTTSREAVEMTLADGSVIRGFTTAHVPVPAIPVAEVDDAEV